MHWSFADVSESPRRVKYGAARHSPSVSDAHKPEASVTSVSKVRCLAWGPRVRRRQICSQDLTLIDVGFYSAPRLQRGKTLIQGLEPQVIS
jgi:hypothetical protein